MSSEEDEQLYYGVWKIIECVSLAGVVEPTGIEGTIFHLDPNGDVSWKISEDAEPLPLFSCETYQMSSNAQCGSLLLKLYGTYEGHVIEFRVEVSQNLMLLTYERCCMIQCQKISSYEPKFAAPFTLLPALEEGFFSDISIYSATRQKFDVHQLILRLNAPNTNWTPGSTPLDGLEDDIIKAALHYLYAECLPESLTEDTAKRCTEAVGNFPDFVTFVRLCNDFINTVALKQQMFRTISEVHSCVDRVIELYSDKGGGIAPDLIYNPAKICYTFKQTTREIIQAFCHGVIFCEMFLLRKSELSRKERHEIIKYTKTRLPIFLKQIHTLLSLCRDYVSNLSPSLVMDIASYFVPEIEVILKLARKLFEDVQVALEQTISESLVNVSHNDHSGKPNSPKTKSKKSYLADVLGSTLQHVLHMRELKKLQVFQEKLAAELRIISMFEQNFHSLSHIDRVAYTVRNINHLSHEIPHVILRLEQFSMAKVSWKDWKYLFKLGTSKVVWALGKVQKSESSLRTVIKEICDFMQRDVFTKSLRTLRLLDPQSAGSSGLSINNKATELQSFCSSPTAMESQSARELLELLKAQTSTDMVFKVVAQHDCTDLIANQLKPAEMSPDGESYLIKAHCVVMATRCEWFRRALLSGMRESLDKCISVHDTSVQLFSLFLQFLYSGQIDMTSLTTYHIADMMTLSDKYEVNSLTSICEFHLCKRLTDDTAHYLLTLADQLNSSALKESALAYIVQNAVDANFFDSLSDSLKLDIEISRHWSGVNSTKMNEESNTFKSSLDDVADLMVNTHISHSNDRLSTSSSNEEIERYEYDSCVSTLREIVDESVTDDELMAAILASDYDINRALNYLFSPNDLCDR